MKKRTDSYENCYKSNTFYSHFTAGFQKIKYGRPLLNLLLSKDIICSSCYGFEERWKKRGKGERKERQDQSADKAEKTGL